MQLSGNQSIHASREAVWRGLNDPEVLRRSIPGCVSLELLADNRMQAVVEVKIGPIGARFNGEVVLSDQVPPQSYTISGQGQGGTVGNAKGEARVALTEEAGGTLLSYQIDVQVGGRLAQLGGPIIDATAKQLAGKFFRSFGELVGGESAQPVTAVPDQALPAQAVSTRTPTAQVDGGTAVRPAVLLLGLLSAALIGFLVGRAQSAVAAADWIGLSVGLLVVIVAAAAFDFGRRTAAPIVMFDGALLRRLARGDEA